MTVVENRETVAQDRRINALLNHVVHQQRIVASALIVKRVEIVFTVRRCDASFECQTRQSAIENLALASL